MWTRTQSQLLWMESAGCNGIKMSQSPLKAFSPISFSDCATAKFMEHGKFFQLGRLVPVFFFFVTLQSKPRLVNGYSSFIIWLNVNFWKWWWTHKCAQMFHIVIFVSSLLQIQTWYDLAMASTTPRCCLRYFWEISPPIPPTFFMERTHPAQSTLLPLNVACSSSDLPSPHPNKPAIMKAICLKLIHHFVSEVFKGAP